MKARALQTRRPNESAPRPYDAALIPALAEVAPVASGWKRSAFNGSWPWIPEFRRLVATDATTVDALRLPDGQESQGVAFEGYVNIPADGAYEVELDSTNPSMVFIHESRVISTEGPDAKTTGLVNLAAGWHPVRVYASAITERSSLQLSITNSAGKNVLDAVNAVAH